MTQALDGVLAALADPTRRSIFEQLLDTGPASATTLSRGRSVTRQAVVKHLQVLADAGLLSSERAGREVRYRAEPRGMDETAAWLRRAGAAWDRRLDRLREQVEQVEPVEQVEQVEPVEQVDSA